MAFLSVLHGCCTVQLTQGKNTLVDEADWPEINQHRWFASFFCHYFYAMRSQHICMVDKRQKLRRFKMHRVITDAPADCHVDHRDGDTLNNTRSNLRVATPTQNSQNRRRAGGSSRFKGVARCYNGWEARIQRDKKPVYLGYFAIEEEAARAYDAAAIEFFGEFAATNAELFGEY